MNLGQIEDKDYFSRTEVSNSDLSLIKQSWSHFLEKNRRQTTDAMTFGKAFDQLLLRPVEFHKNFIIAPQEIDRRTKEGKLMYQSLIESGRDILTSSDWTNLNLMKNNVETHPISSRIIKESEKEGSFTGILEGVEVRCKIDIFNQGYLFDIKTCQSAQSSEFKRTFASYGYHRQMAFYLDILKQNIEGVRGAGLIPVEKISSSSYLPSKCGVNVFWLSEQSLEQGQFEYKKLLEKYKFFKENPEIYPGYSDKIEVLDLPLWALQG